nr:hypothetical protein [Nostoc sp. ChiSLP03a]
MRDGWRRRSPPQAIANHWLFPKYYAMEAIASAVPSQSLLG